MNYVALGLVIFTFVGASGQTCKTTSGGTGYCREKSDCFGSSEQGDCPSDLTCCHRTHRSEKKCKDYGSLVFRQEFNEALTARAFVHNVSECGIGAVPLIVGGVKSKLKEFPHMVAIGYGKSVKEAMWLCGGSLISERYVLSAAHCSKSEGRGRAKFARMGTINLKSPGDHSQDVPIAECINHPKYVPGERYNDIALFRLSHPVRMSGYVRPACLHTNPDEFSLKKATATGWGKTSYSKKEGSENLLKVTLSIVAYPRCNSTFAAEMKGSSLSRGIAISQICAGEMEGGKDSCQGDSGGPLQTIRNDPYCMYSVVGVISFGKLCGFKNSPAVYTRVSYFVPWIESIVWREPYTHPAQPHRRTWRRAHSDFSSRQQQKP